MPDKSLNDANFQNRAQAATTGDYLPTVEDLMRGMPFFLNQLTQDIREYAERLSNKIKKSERHHLTPVAHHLDELALAPSKDSLRAFQKTLKKFYNARELELDDCYDRFCFYLAHFGDALGTAYTANAIANLAKDSVSAADFTRLLSRSLGWSAIAREVDKDSRHGMSIALPPYLIKGVVETHTAISRRNIISKFSFKDKENHMPLAGVSDDDELEQAPEIDGTSTNKESNIVRDKTSLEPYFQRKIGDVHSGDHFPTTNELLGGMPFFKDSIFEDIQEYCKRLRGYLSNHGGDHTKQLLTLIASLGEEPSVNTLSEVEETLAAFDLNPSGLLHNCRARCQLYLAYFGDVQASGFMGGEIARLACADDIPRDSDKLALRALAWVDFSRAVAGKKSDAVAIDMSSDWLNSKLEEYEVRITNVLTSIL